MSGRPTTRGREDRLAAVMFSIAAHLGAFLAIVWVAPKAPPMMELGPMTVALVQPPPEPLPPVPPSPAPPKAAPPAPAASAPLEAPPKRSPRPTTRPPPPQVATLAASEDSPGEAMLGLSDAELAGAAAAGSGSGGGSCDMGRWLQAALRKSPRVQTAIASANRATAGKAFMVWNGDWIRSSGQDGEGLAIVREAMMLEIAFAPEACRTQPVHGLVLISLDDGPRAARFAVGSGRWRWSDLLHARGAVRSRAFSSR